MAYGAPEHLDQVEAYYTDIRRGNPPPPQLLAMLIDRYRAIGGGSPLCGIVERQRAAVTAELRRRGREVRVYAGMKHIAPFVGDVVRRMAGDGIERAVALVLAPQRSSVNAATYRRAVEDAQAALGAHAPPFGFVDSWHDDPRLIEAIAAATAEAIGRFRDPGHVRVVFTAHSLPERITDGDPYPGEVRRTALLVARRLGLRRYEVAFQSAGRTEERWIGPELRDAIRRLAAEGVRDLLVCPVGFVADHLEVLYDIDIEAQQVARDVGTHLERTRSLNDDPTFIAGIADRVEAAFSTMVAA